METKRVDLKQVASAALNMSHTLVPEWLPDGKREGAEWVALNPQRHDSKAFLSCLCGSEPIQKSRTLNVVFLSCLCGSEQAKP